MRALVCGGRDFMDRPFVFSILDSLALIWEIETIVHGAARGADLCAEDWAKVREIDYQGYPARWKLYGRFRAGPERNSRMLLFAQPDLVVAFPGGAGTADMVRRARAYLPHHRVLEIKR